MIPRQVFQAAYKRVCKARTRVVDIEHAEECWRVVQYRRPWMFDEVATRLNATCEFFPTPHDWVAMCETVGREHDAKQTARQHRALPENPDDQTYECQVCLDSGWQYFECKAGQLCAGCRSKGHPYDHRYVRFCVCRPTNQTWRENNPRQTQGAQP